jgi:hypothetical protein
MGTGNRTHAPRCASGRGNVAVADAQTLDQSFVAPFDLLADINDCCRFIAQTFTAGLTGTLAGVNMDVGSDSTFPLHVVIRPVVYGGLV